jgi:hypothetical protein
MEKIMGGNHTLSVFKDERPEIFEILDTIFDTYIYQRVQE